MDHPHFVGGVVRPARLMPPFYEFHTVGSTSIRGSFGLPASVQRDERLVDVQVRLEAAYDPSEDQAPGPSGVTSERLPPRLDMAHDSPGPMGNVIDDLGAAHRQDQTPDPSPVDHIRLITRVDASPNPESRVMLAPEHDRLGQRKAELHWQLSPIDKRSARRTLEVVAGELGRAGLGRVEMLIDNDDATWPADTAGSSHHMGTTRMHEDPVRGVVDRDCRVHGLSNLFVAGSSVFPTGGSGTPTLMIVALALRLADHIVDTIT